MACLLERAPCLPSRIWCISSRTNSPACVDGDLPSRLSRRAREMVAWSGITSFLLGNRSSLGITSVKCAKDSRPQIWRLRGESGGIRRTPNPSRGSKPIMESMHRTNTTPLAARVTLALCSDRLRSANAEKQFAMHWESSNPRLWKYSF